MRKYANSWTQQVTTPDSDLHRQHHLLHLCLLLTIGTNASSPYVFNVFLRFNSSFNIHFSFVDLGLVFAIYWFGLSVGWLCCGKEWFCGICWCSLWLGWVWVMQGRMRQSEACHPDLSGNDPKTTNLCMFINEICAVGSSTW